MLLSETNTKDFPHLTPSITECEGAKDELLYLYNNTNAKFELCGMTRPYLTRHGAGPLPNECSREELSDKIVDKTNMPNDWQGSLRFAPLNLSAMYRIVWSAFESTLFLPDDSRLSFAIGITCLDQTDGNLIIKNVFDRVKRYSYHKLQNNVYHQKIYAFFGEDTLPIITI